jgi:hypothetical protein
MLLTTLKVKLLNGVTNYGGTFGEANIHIGEDVGGNLSNLSGLIKSDRFEAGLVIAEVPAAFAPLATQVFTVHTGQGPQRVDVLNTGKVVYRGVPFAGFLSLNNITLVNPKSFG